MSPDAGSGVPGEIHARLTALAEAARKGGAAVLPPLLILGTCERVGSNWVSDMLRPVAGQHNEPFRQQIGPDHPWSARNPLFAGTAVTASAAIGLLGRHWLVSFAVAKYRPDRQVVKETSLFFASRALLTLLPGSPVLVLSRSPLGVASSFTRGDLFRRWGYRSRYQQMITMTRHGDSVARRFAALIPDDAPADQVALVRLQVLNTVLIADALADRDLAHISYETAVTGPGDALAALTKVLPELDGLALSNERTPILPRPAPASDDTFATTNHKTTLIAGLEAVDAALIRAATAASLAAVHDVVPAPVAARTASWLAGDHLYRLEPPRQRTVASRAVLSGTHLAAAPRYIRRGHLQVRNVLVSNAEYARFLNALSQAGLANSHHGTYLLACEMPHERGGRLHRDRATDAWAASLGYENYPAYWVTWIGAAAFAAWTGSRLPARAELTALTSGAATTGNAGYRFGDVTPVIEPGMRWTQIHHLLGNLQTWCCDGPDEPAGGPAARWLHGIAWNTPATQQAAQQPRCRHILGCSRGVGIRLVRDGSQQPMRTRELAGRLAAWITSLADRSRPLAEIDEQLIRALDASQADSGLGSHVSAGAGEPRHG
jgi:formylglycine-generating enzyme required for sulfatase activity